MMEFSLLPWNIITSVHVAMEEVFEGFATRGIVGLILVSMIELPVILVIIASVLDTPRNYRVPALFLGLIALLLGGAVLGFAGLSIVLQLIVPQ